jgi:phosphate-selective porin OprO/OprP
MKEPFSLEMQTSIVNRTFLDLALPTSALARGRNIGIRFDTTAFDERMTWAVGAFLNTSASGSLEEQKYQLKNPEGYDLSGRVTYLPRYEDNGRDLMHLGLSYTHGFRDEDDNDEKVQFRTRPETRLTDARLVDTGKFSNGGFDIINPEFGVVRGPLSFQGEYFHAFTESKQEDDPGFWGYYLFVSYFLTGESRRYDPSKALFSELPLDRGFDFFKGGWGAWELGLRQSYVDLNGGEIRGGKELNFTLGLNWYLRRNMRMMFNYVWARVKDRESPEVDDAKANIFQLRFQLYF